MSGSKSSDISFDARASLLLSVRATRAQALNEKQAQADHLERLIRELVAETAASEQVQSQLRRLQKRANEAMSLVRREIRELESVGVPENVVGTTESGLSALLSALRVKLERGREVADVVGEVEEDFARLTAADERAVRVRVLLREAAEFVKANTRVLDAHSPSIFNRLNQEISDSLGVLSHGLDLAGKNLGDEADNVLVKLEGRAESLITQAREEVEVAVEVGRRQVERDYVLQALRETCLALGFEEMQARSVERDDAGELVKEFDTLDNGRIVFRVGLDSHIQVESEMESSSCPIEFGRLRELMQKGFGVEATPFTVAEPHNLSEAAKLVDTRLRESVVQSDD